MTGPKKNPPPLPGEKGRSKLTHDTDVIPVSRVVQEEPPALDEAEAAPPADEEPDTQPRYPLPADEGQTEPKYPMPENGGKTEIMQAAEQPAAEPQLFPSLQIETPDGNRTEMPITGERLIIGRAPENDLVIPDQLVSRRHAVIEQGPGGWKIIDNQSGNGTLLNGRRISEADLHDGDVITIGKTRLFFQAPAAAGPGSPEKTRLMDVDSIQAPGATGTGGVLPARKRRRLLYLSAGVAFFVSVLFVIKTVTKPRGPSPEEIARQQRLQLEAEKKRQAAEVFDALRKSIVDNKWSEANSLLAQLELLSPEDPKLPDYKKTVTRELAAEKSFLEAQARMAAEDMDGALGLLSQIPADSLLAEKAKQLQALAAQKKLDILLRNAREKMEQKDFEQVIALADQALQMQPESEAAAELKRQAEEQLNRKKGGEKKPLKEAKPAPVKARGALLQGDCLKLYQEGKITDALAIAEASGVGADGVEKLRKFEKLYQRGLELSNNPGMADKAVEFLQAALDLDRSLSAGRGKINEELTRRLAKCLFLVGVDNHNRKRYPEAFQAYKKALQYDPQMSQATKRLEDLAAEAKKLYDTAYVLKASSSEKAIEICSTVIKMTDTDNYANDRCKKLIASLKTTGSSGGEEDF